MYCPSIFSQRSFSVQWQSTGISKFNGIFFSWFTAEVIYRCINVVLLNIYIKSLNFNYSLKLKTWTFADSYLLAQYFILHSTIFLTYWLALRAFCQNRNFGDDINCWMFSGWISANLAVIYLKKHLQQDTMPFFSLASCIKTFLLRNVQKSKFGD